MKSESPVLSVVMNVVRGLVIGVANIIPGVSGGTMALVLGIFERLIGAIHNISVDTILITLKLITFKKEAVDDFVTEMKRIDLVFLISIFSGAVLAVFALASLMSFLLIEMHDPTYGFFFGLVAASIIVPFLQVKRWTIGVVLAALVAAMLVSATEFMNSDESRIAKVQQKYELKLNDAGTSAAASTFEIQVALVLFVSGAIAISAMILPGISGSFLLILMGQYFVILKAVKDFNIPYLAVFSIGILLGLAAFTRILKYLLSRWTDITMGFLGGLVIGSLPIIWPFRDSILVGSDLVEGYPEKVFLSLKMPGIDVNFILTLACALAGLTLVFIMLRIERKFAKK